MLGLNKRYLYSVFKDFKDKLDAIEIRPLLVFEGIQCNKYSLNYKTQLNLHHTQVWSYIANGQTKAAHDLIQEYWTYTLPINELFGIFDELKIEFMVGPYNHLA